MSKPSLRKQHRQKDRQRQLAKRKSAHADRALFPDFDYRTNNAPAGFVDLIQRTLKTIDFRDRAVFSVQEINFFKRIKRSPDVVMPLMMCGLSSRNLVALHL